jgi:hypothetical protein
MPAREGMKERRDPSMSGLAWLRRHWPAGEGRRPGGVCKVGGEKGERKREKRGRWRKEGESMTCGSHILVVGIVWRYGG